VVIAVSLTLTVLAMGPRHTLNHLFAIFTLVVAIWATASFFMVMTSWLEVGGLALALEVATLAFVLLGPLLLLFAARYVNRRSRWTDLGALAGLAVLAMLSIPLFRHQLVLDPRVGLYGLVHFDFSVGGYLSALVPILFFAWSFVLFWRERRRSGTWYFAASVLILMLGMIVGALLQFALPIMSTTTPVSMAILCYGIVSRQLLNPLQELTARLEERVGDRTRELEVAYQEIERAYGEVEGRVDERTAELQQEISERERLEHELEERRLYLERVLACAPDAIVTLSAQGSVLEWNAGAERLFGYSYEEAVGQNIDELVSGADRGTFEEAVDLTRRAQSGERISPRETVRYRKNGMPVEVIVSGSPILLEDKILGVVAVYSDISQRRQVETERAELLSALQHRSTQLQTAIEVSKSASVILDPDELVAQTVHLIQDRFDLYYVGLFLLDETGEYAVLRAGTGDAFAQMSETDHKLKVGGPSMVGWCTAQGEARIAQDVGEERVRFENPLLPDTRSEMALPLISRGRCMGALSVQSTREHAFTSEDVEVLQTMVDQIAVAIENARLLETERRRGEELESLRQASLHVTSILELQPVLDAIIEHALMLVSAGNAHIFLYDEDTLTFGAAVWAGGLQREPYAKPRQNGLTYTVARLGKRIVVGDVDVHPLFQDRRWGGAAAGFPLRVGDEVSGVMNIAFEQPHIFTDSELNVLELLADQAAIAIHNARLHEQLRAHAEELAAALAQQEELDRLKGEFVQNVSHELRSPLALIRGYAEMLSGEELGELQPDQIHPISVISRRSRMLSELVEDITLILGAETRPQVWESVSLDEVARMAVDEFRVTADQAKLTLRADIASVPQVRGSLTYLRRVLDNLLSNAIKFTPEDGIITVSVYPDQEWVVLRVTDTGIGIPADKLDRIFERFYQVDGSARRRYGGVGLGLALVRELVEFHGGQVEVESKVDSGTSFIVRLPAIEGEMPSR
jgi:PAS domain S-box-containing protein